MFLFLAFQLPYFRVIAHSRAERVKLNRAEGRENAKQNKLWAGLRCMSSRVDSPAYTLSKRRFNGLISIVLCTLTRSVNPAYESHNPRLLYYFPPSSVVKLSPLVERL
jgi:hypothetical protein